MQQASAGSLRCGRASNECSTSGRRNAFDRTRSSAHSRSALSSSCSRAMNPGWSSGALCSRLPCSATGSGRKSPLLLGEDVTRPECHLPAEGHFVDLCGRSARVHLDPVVVNWMEVPAESRSGPRIGSNPELRTVELEQKPGLVGGVSGPWQGGQPSAQWRTSQPWPMGGAPASLSPGSKRDVASVGARSVTRRRQPLPVTTLPATGVPKTVTVVICSFNGRARVGGVLEALARQTSSRLLRHPGR